MVKKQKEINQPCDFNPLKFIKIYFMTKCSVYFGEHSMCIWVACVFCRFRISGFPDSSVDKQSACNADPSSIPGSGRSPGEGIGYPLQYSRASPVFSGFPCDSAGKELACNVGDLGLIPGLGRSPGEGKGYPLQYSGILAWRIPWTA